MDEQKKQWLLQRAKELRRNQTPQEIELWGIIRAKRFEGLKFYRQYMVGSYIVDFCCPEKILVVELDGSRHTPGEKIMISNETKICGSLAIESFVYGIVTGIIIGMAS